MINNVVLVQALFLRLKIGRSVDVGDAELVKVCDEPRRVAERERTMKLEPVGGDGDLGARKTDGIHSIPFMVRNSKITGFWVRPITGKTTMHLHCQAMSGQSARWRNDFDLHALSSVRIDARSHPVFPVRMFTAVGGSAETSCARLLRFAHFPLWTALAGSNAIRSTALLTFSAPRRY